jgi:hypothetical protein
MTLLQRFSPITFALAFSIAYAVVFWFNLPMFLYYPQSGMFHLGPTPVANVGPGIAWYGLMSDAAVVALVAAFIVPNDIVDKPLRNFLWAIPVAAILVCLYLLRNLLLA